MGWNNSNALNYGVQGGASGALTGGTFGPWGAAIGGAAGLIGGGLLGGFGSKGKRKMYGPSEEEIARMEAARRAAYQNFDKEVLHKGLQGIGNATTAHGFASNGAAAAPMADLHRNVAGLGLQQEANIANTSAGMRASRTYDYQPGVAEQVMPVLQSAAGTASYMNMLGGLGGAEGDSLAHFGSGVEDGGGGMLSGLNYESPEVRRRRLMLMRMQGTQLSEADNWVPWSP